MNTYNFRLLDFIKLKGIAMVVIAIAFLVFTQFALAAPATTISTPIMSDDKVSAAEASNMTLSGTSGGSYVGTMFYTDTSKIGPIEVRTSSTTPTVTTFPAMSVKTIADALAGGNVTNILTSGITINGWHYFASSDSEITFNALATPKYVEISKFNLQHTGHGVISDLTVRVLADGTWTISAGSGSSVNDTWLQGRGLDHGTWQPTESYGVFTDDVKVITTPIVVSGGNWTKDNLDITDVPDGTVYALAFSTDGTGKWTKDLATASFTKDTQAPTAVTLNPSEIDENQPSGTEVGTLSATDETSGDTHTYSFCSGGADNDQFTIDGDKLKTAAVFDYETKSSYEICVTATDAAGNSVDQNLTVTVADVNEGGGATTSGGSGGGGGTITGLYGATNNSCDADFNDDGKIDIFDLNILAVHWGSANGTSTTGDANCDGKVDIFDLNAVAVSWSE